MLVNKYFIGVIFIWIFAYLCISSNVCFLRLMQCSFNGVFKLSLDCKTMALNMAS